MSDAIKFWGNEGDESLHHTDMDEAINDIINDLERLEGEIVVYGYAPMEKPDAEKLAKSILDFVLEELDCNYELGSPDHATEASEPMQEAALFCAGKILNNYEPWAHKVVKEQTIDVVEWTRQHRPDWYANEFPEDRKGR